MAEEETQPKETTEPKPAPVTSEPPDWVTELKTTMQELPGRLAATLTDDDKDGIAERVHGLFERSGAFREAEEEKEAGEGGKEAEKEVEKTEHEAAPQKASGMARFAQWFSGE